MPPPITTKLQQSLCQKLLPFIALQLRVAKLEQDMSEVKKTDHSAAVLASIQSQVPTVVDKYLGTKLDDALLKTLERHTADLVEKYSVLPAPESSKKKESEKSPEEIIIIKREQEEKKQEPTYTIKSTDKAALEEFDLKSALFKSMHKNKSANRNPANYILYHALMEALIEDENAMDKEVADKVKDHKRKRDSDDDEDDDDEGPSAGSNQGDSTKRRRHDSSASWSAQPPSKDYEQSTKYKLDSNTYAAQQPPAHTSLAWQISDIRDTPPGPSMQTTDHQSEQSFDDNPITDEGHVSDLEDTDNAHIPKVPAATWFKPIPEEERPATPEPEWTIPSNDYPELENNWENVYATMYQDPKENKLQRKTFDIGSFIKWFCKRTGKKKLCKADLEGLTFNLVKAFHNNNVSLQFQMDECHSRKQFHINKYSEPFRSEAVRSQMRILRQDGPPTKAASLICNNAVTLWTKKHVRRKEVLMTCSWALRAIKLNLHLEQPNLGGILISFPKKITTIVFKPRAVIYRDRDDNRKMMRIDEVHKFSDGTLTRIKEKLEFTWLKISNYSVLNTSWRIGNGLKDDKRRSKDFIELVDIEKVAVSSSLRSLKPKCTIENTSETKVFHNEDGNPTRANIKQALVGDLCILQNQLVSTGKKMSYERSHKGVKASANSDIVYFFTSAQDGDPLQDDVRLCLGDDLKKAQDHNQRQVKDESKDHYPK
ncbi:hypothetical protein Tco_0407731, partial [Tanacetum coccineum]